MEAKASNLATATVAGGLIAGALVAGYEWFKAHEHHAAAAVPTPTGSTPATSTTPASSAAVTNADLAKQLAAAKRQQDIENLRSELSGVWNQMDVLAVQLDSIRRQADPPGTYEAIKTELYAVCMPTKGWFFAGLQCDGVVTPAAINAEMDKRRTARITNLSQPYQAQLSELDNRQKALVANLAGLGFTVPRQDVRSVTK